VKQLLIAESKTLNEAVLSLYESPYEKFLQKYPEFKANAPSRPTIFSVNQTAKSNLVLSPVDSFSPTPSANPSLHSPQSNTTITNNPFLNPAFYSPGLINNNTPINNTNTNDNGFPAGNSINPTNSNDNTSASNGNANNTTHLALPSIHASHSLPHSNLATSTTTRRDVKSLPPTPSTLSPQVPHHHVLNAPKSSTTRRVVSTTSVPFESGIDDSVFASVKKGSFFFYSRDFFFF
jgi:hypothetical protein